jgi:membrane-associated phospholipid phosphatase
MNQTLFDQINAFARATPWLHGVITVYAAYGVVVFALLLGAGWWSARCSGEPRRMAAVVCAGAATLLAVGLNQPIVNAVHEARPYTDHPDVLVLATRSADFSFPSDHAVMAGAVAVGLVFVSRRLAALAGVAALTMAFARVYIAAHYPTDVAVGLALGQRWRWSSTSSLTGCSPPPLPPSWRATALYGRYSRPRRRGKKRRSTLDDRAGGPATRRPGAVLYAQVAAVVVVEDALFVGFVVPGETVAVLGGVAASLGPASLPGDDGDRGGSGDRR